MKRIINCCKHDILVKKDDGDFIKFEPSGIVVRIKRETKGCSNVLGCNVITRGKVIVNLPAPQKDVLYLVSRIVLESVYREDLIAPETFNFSKYLYSKKSVCIVKNLIMRTE